MTAVPKAVLKTLCLLAYPRSSWYDRWRGLSPAPRPVAPAPAALTPAERAVVDVVTALIVPTDHQAGAREVGTVGYIEATIAARPALARTYRDGVRWLDYAARKCFRRAFLALTPDQQRRLLGQLDGRGASRLEQRRLALFYRDLGPARRFFWTVRRHTFEAFYTSPAGQAVAGFALPVRPREDATPAPAAAR